MSLGVWVCMGGGTLPFRMCTNQSQTHKNRKTYTHMAVIICCKDFNISECIDGTRRGAKGGAAESNVSRNLKAVPIAHSRILLQQQTEVHIPSSKPVSKSSSRRRGNGMEATRVGERRCCHRATNKSASG